MLFNSIQYLIFLPLVVLIFYLIPHKYRWVFLLSASYYFYMCWKIEYALLLIIITLNTYFTAILIARSNNFDVKRFFFIFSLCITLGILLFFKYYNFVGSSINDTFRLLKFPYFIPYIDILLPIGISFYTFQSLSYLIDVYEEKRIPEFHLGYFSAFIAYFPLLIAGPIERSANLLPQLSRKNPFLSSNISQGIKFIILGFFLKLVIADRAAIYVNIVFNNVSNYDGITFIAAAILFSFQIYCDFAGYSYIAVGSSRLLGINLTMNFNRPYFANSIQEFWRRWHISLSTWLSDYIFMPLSIRYRHYKVLGITISILLTFLVSGLWHGANWTFLIWGMLHGFYLISETLFFKQRKRNLLNIIITFLQVSFAWIFFRANSMDDALFIVNKIFTYPGKLFIPQGEDIATPIYAVFAIGVLLLFESKIEYFNRAFNILNNEHETIRMTAYAFMIFMILYLGVFGEGQFIYFKF